MLYATNITSVSVNSVLQNAQEESKRHLMETLNSAVDTGASGKAGGGKVTTQQSPQNLSQLSVSSASSHLISESL